MSKADYTPPCAPPSSNQFKDLKNRNEARQRGKNSASRQPSYSCQNFQTAVLPCGFHISSPPNCVSQFLKTPPSPPPLPFSQHKCMCTHTYTHLIGFVSLENPNTVCYLEILLVFLITSPSSKPLSSEKK